MPEGFFALAQATLYLATAPKGNAVGRAYGAALRRRRVDAQRSRAAAPAQRADRPDEASSATAAAIATRTTTTPNSATRRPARCRRRSGSQDYLPQNIADREYFQPGTQGDEAPLRDWIAERRRREGGMTRIYLDHAATTPCRPEVVDAMVPHLGEGGYNPSSLHAEGRAARAALDGARRRVAAALGATPREIVFTGGGTRGRHARDPRRRARRCASAAGTP